MTRRSGVATPSGRESSNDIKRITLWGFLPSAWFGACWSIGQGVLHHVVTPSSGHVAAVRFPHTNSTTKSPYWQCGKDFESQRQGIAVPQPGRLARHLLDSVLRTTFVPSHKGILTTEVLAPNLGGHGGCKCTSLFCPHPSTNTQVSLLAPHSLRACLRLFCHFPVRNGIAYFFFFFHSYVRPQSGQPRLRVVRLPRPGTEV
jgi:hypothetical protein